MKHYYTISIILVSLMLTACGKGRDASVQKIQDLEIRLEQEKNPTLQGPLVYDLEVLYNDFADRYPDDTLSPEFLYRAFEQNLKLGWFDRAIQSADLLIKKYPQSPKTPEVMFNKAFIYDDKKNDDAKAGEIYREFLEKYPDHALSADAQNSIRFLGLSPEETLRKIEEMHMLTDSSSVTAGVK